MIWRRATHLCTCSPPRSMQFNTLLSCFSSFNLPMEKSNLPPKRQLIESSSASAPPSPILTAKGSRSAADSILSEYVDKSVRIPDLRLPQNVRRFKPDEIDYGSIVSRDEDSVRRFFTSIRELGVVQISDHGIVAEELRDALSKSERIFGLTIECCTSYGDHERIVWPRDDSCIAEEAAAAIGEQNYHIFRQKIEGVARKLEGIAKELGTIIDQSGGKQMELGESRLSIFRYHRANIIDRNSSQNQETNQESTTDDQYTLSLHLFLDSSELCLKSRNPNLSYDSKPNTIVVTPGKHLQEWSGGVELMVKGLVHTSRASFSIQQKWSSPKLKMVVGESDNPISLSDQILFLLLLLFFYNSFLILFSSL